MLEIILKPDVKFYKEATKILQMETALLSLQRISVNSIRLGIAFRGIESAGRMLVTNGIMKFKSIN